MKAIRNIIVGVLVLVGIYLLTIQFYAYYCC
jgi:uncharacterized membrane protein (Fun14 family)